MNHAKSDRVEMRELSLIRASSKTAGKVKEEQQDCVCKNMVLPQTTRRPSNLPVAAKTLAMLPRALRREDRPVGPRSTFRQENGAIAADHTLPAVEGMKW